MKIGDRIYVRGYIDEIRKDTVIIRNAGGYFGTIPSEVITGELPSAQPDTRSLEQIKWERDIAIQQLKDLGYSLGEKIRTDGDTISRQALMKEFADFVRRSNNSDFAPTPTWNDAVSLVGSMPSAQQEQRWIPSGKKPPEKGSYLVWMPFAPPKHRMTVAEYCGGYWNIKTPISAWMPLPEPYKEGTDD